MEVKELSNFFFLSPLQAEFQSVREVIGILRICGNPEENHPPSVIRKSPAVLALRPFRNDITFALVEEEVATFHQDAAFAIMFDLSYPSEKFDGFFQFSRKRTFYLGVTVVTLVSNLIKIKIFT